MASPDASGGTQLAGSTTILVRDDPTLGKILTDSRGFTLYVFSKDSSGKSVCNDQCAVNWPPLMADGAATAPDGVTGTLSLITRDDGSQMVAYNGKPLYTYIKDTDPEDTYGQGVGNVWSVATP
jgi:predicted lipoprotein with Yx(FWY)xxD motif